MKRSPTLALISLGCAKNLVDSEIILGQARRAGLRVIAETHKADVLLINTCAFIHDAKQESIDAIFSARQANPHQKIIVAGCLAQRFANELQIPEIDTLIGIDQVRDVVPVILETLGNESPHTQNLVTSRPSYIPDYQTPRYRLTPPHTAYVKIAEGCDHRCSFCAIPQIRGRHRSRPVEDILKEVRQLLRQGVKELLLISQDTTAYGRDLSQRNNLPRLLREIQRIPGKFWIRLHYTHPAHWDDRLIRVFRECDKLVPYIDIPLQHSHPEILRKMKRRTTEKQIRELIAKIRQKIPYAGIRTAFIVGFPGETEAHFRHLLNFIQEMRFERLGIFPYSAEEGTPATRLAGKVHPRTVVRRHREAMLLQMEIAKEIQREQIGKQIPVITDGGNIARSWWDAPEIDGRVFLKKRHQPGRLLNVTASQSDIYDLKE